MTKDQNLGADAAAVGNDTPVAAPERQAPTPGPWEWYGDGELWSVIDREAFDRAFDAARDRNGDVEMCDLRFVDKPILTLLDLDDLSEANAHLIAAAPDLLEAVKLFMTCYPAAITALSDDMRHKIEAAIAKAEGR